MSYDNTKTKGDLAELEVVSYLARRGYRVSLPFGENAPYDLVAESPTGRLYRVQVRWCSWSNDALRLSLRVTSKNYSRTIDRDRIEVFAMWDGEAAFFVPTDHTRGCAAEISLRRKPTRNNQTAGIRLASTYRDAVAFMP